jgi:hypothetical protein
MAVKLSASTAAKPDLMVIDELEQEPAYDWMNPIRMFLDNQLPSDDNVKVECIACKSKMYHLIDGVLYRRGDNGMMMRCISREECIQLLQDIHSYVCVSHLSLLIANNDMIEIVTKCKDC